MSWGAHPAPHLGKSAKKTLQNAPSERPEALRNPVQGRNLDDDANEHRELECQRSARDLLQEALLHPVQCENLEDLHDDAHGHQELECELSA